MVFSFSLPTTSHLSFQSFLSSSTHPSLPQSASIARHSLRSALKKHRHLSAQQQASNLPSILNALNEYIPYLFTLSDGLRGKTGGEEVDIILRTEIEAEWRTTLTIPASSFLRTSRRIKGRRQRYRVKGRGLDFEIAFTLATLGYVLSGIGRDGVSRTLYASTTPTPEQRTTAVQAATRNLLMASAVHAFVASSALDITASIVTSKSRSKGSSATNPTAGTDVGGLDTVLSVPDLDPSTQSSLSALALSEATLLAVLKDDAYLAATIQERNPNDKEWMVKAPEIPKVRALVFARLCVRGAEYAEQAASGAEAVGTGKDSGQAEKGGKVDEELVNYMRALAAVARARACRFFGLDAEMGGKTGEGIAWLRAARGILKFKKGLLEGDEDATGSGKSKAKGLSRLKKGWTDMREERKMEKQSGSGAGGGDSEFYGGDDAGREEEGRVIDSLEAKWVKMNDTINTQLIPSPQSLLATFPSGRDIHSTQQYTPPTLDDAQLIRLRGPPEDDDRLPGVGNDDIGSSSDEEGPELDSVGRSESGLPGGFPASRASSAVGTGYF